ncbi:MAG: hypothetical protein FJ398_14170 [Verrucomicrobia bacterium]|nr:hypothetical protein [Verrucomicrobiota bacterium]
MALPDLVLNNLRWKAGALTMAVFIWFLIQFAISRGYRPPRETPLSDTRDHTFTDVPVLALTAPDNAEVFRATPAKVEITVRGTPLALNQLAKDDIRAFVDLSDTNVVSEIKDVLVRTPHGIDLTSITVKPAQVKVGRIGEGLEVR